MSRLNFHQDVDAGTHSASDEVFTVYIKDMGSWTKALREAARGPEAISAPGTMIVDVDGFYGHVNSFSSITSANCERVMIFAGGAGMTSFIGYIQVSPPGLAGQERPPPGSHTLTRWFLGTGDYTQEFLRSNACTICLGLGCLSQANRRVDTL